MRRTAEQVSARVFFSFDRVEKMADPRGIPKNPSTAAPTQSTPPAPSKNPSLSTPPPPPNQRFVATCELHHQLKSSERIGLLAGIMRLVGKDQVVMADPQQRSKTHLAVLLRSQQALDKLVAAGTVSYGGIVFATAVTAGLLPRQQPGVRIKLFGLPLGYTKELVAYELEQQVGHVRHVEPDYWRDENGKPTTIMTTSCTAWVDPDAKQVRRVTMAGCEAKVVDPRLPQRQRRRRRRRNKKTKSKEDAGKGKDTVADEAGSAASATAPSLAPTPSTTSTTASAPPSAAAPDASAAAAASSSSSSRRAASAIFVVGGDALADREEEWQQAQGRRRRGRSPDPARNSTASSSSPTASASADAEKESTMDTDGMRSRSASPDSPIRRNASKKVRQRATSRSPPPPSSTASASADAME